MTINRSFRICFGLTSFFGVWCFISTLLSNCVFSCIDSMTDSKTKQSQKFAPFACSIVYYILPRIEYPNIKFNRNKTVMQLRIATQLIELSWINDICNLICVAYLLPLPEHCKCRLRDLVGRFLVYGLGRTVLDTEHLNSYNECFTHWENAVDFHIKIKSILLILW